MLNGSAPRICAKTSLLILSLLAVSAPSRAQFVSFAGFTVPTPNSTPGCIVHGPDGALWFTETTEFSNKIGRVTTDGAITEYPIPTFNSSPYCITAGPDGALWFTESKGNNIGRISTGGAITEYPVPTANAGPFGIVAGPDGAVWFTESTAGKIGRVNNGIITEFTIPTAASYPVGITAGSDGALWFTEGTGNKIGHITIDGVITEFALRRRGSAPWGITAGPDGAVWFTEQTSSTIGRITVAGAITEFAVPTTGSIPWGITTGPDGALWFTERKGNKVARISTAGNFSEYAIPEVPGNPFGISVGSDGALWLTDDGPNIIIRAALVAQPPPLSIFTTPPLANASVGVYYSRTLSGTGGTPPYTWAVSAGSLPGGLALGSTTGGITGIPTSSGQANFTAQITDATGTTASKEFPILIQANPINQFPLPLTYRFGGITRGPDGALWFTESTSGPNTNNVGRITTAGVVTEYPAAAPCDCDGLKGITSGPDGALWFAAGTSIGRISTDGVVTEYPVPNAISIDGIASGPDGALWFTDDLSNNSNYIGRITTAGVVTQFPVTGHADSNGIYSITTGPDGALWFTEAVGYIGRITTAGDVTEFPVAAVPTRITAGPDGALWFTDSNGAIGRITTAGTVTEYPTPTVSDLLGISTGPDGALWFTEPSANKIGRITTGGAILEFPIPSADAGLPGSITTGPDGALWFTQDGGEGGGAIGRLLPAPTLTGINPASGAQGSSVRVLLTGASFVSDGTSVNVPAGIALTNFTFISATQVAVTFTIAPNAPLGPVNVTVSTSSGASGPVTFTITPPPPPPVLTSITPASGVQGTSVPVDLTGASFVAGPTMVGTNFPDDYNQLVPFTQTSTLIDNGRLTVTATVYPDPADTTSQWVDFNFQSVNGGPLASNAAGFWQAYLSNIPLTTPGSFTGAQYYWTINGTAAPNIAAIPGLYPVVTNLINPALGSAYGSIFEGGTPLSFMAVFAQLSDYATGLRQGGMDSQAVNGFHIAARTTGGVFGPATILVSNPGVTVTNLNLVSATEITAVLNIATNATLGPANVTVSTPLGTSALVTFTVLPPPPTLTSITPNAGTAGRTIGVTLNGTNFIAGGTTVSVGGGVTVTNVTVTSGIQLTATVSIPAAATPGPVDVTAATAGGTAGPVSFTIDAIPSITTATLPVGVVGTSYSSGVFVNGGTPPYTWAVTAGALPAGLSLDPATCSDPPAPFQRPNIAAHASKANGPFISRQSAGTSCLIVGAPTTYVRSTFTLQVTDSSGAIAKKALVLTVNPPPPTVSSINPATGVQGTILTVTFTGTNFVPGTTLFLNNPGLMASNIVAVSPTQLTATFTIAAGAVLGASNVVLTTTGGAAAPVQFTVLPPPPVLSSIAPLIGSRSSTVSVRLTGSGFTSGVTVASDVGGITVSSVVVVSPTLITATLMIANDAAVGPVQVTVVSSSGASGAVTFTVSPLQLTSINPTTGAAGTSVPVTLAGAGFGTDSQVGSSSADVTVINLAVVNSSQITATLKIAPTAAEGAVNIAVTSGGVTSAPVTFAIGRPNPATLTSISPAFAAQGSTTSVTLTGTGFVAGARIGASNTGVTVNNIVVVSATQITATFTIAANTAPGPVNVTVTTPGGSSGPVVFTVLAPLTLSSISPAAGAQGASVPITLTGTGFATGAQVAVNNPGVVAGSVVVVNSTQITATLTIDAAAATGAANVTVTLGGATSAAAVFTINPPKPTLTSISAAGAPQGANVAVTLTGTNFITGATVAFGNSGITATDVVVSSATKITATLSIAADAVLGGTTVTVSTAGGASGPVNFTVKRAINFAVTGLSGSLPSGQQVPFTVSIGEPSADDLSANLTIQFTPSPSLPPDPTIALLGGTCSSNGSVVTCSTTFQIAASDTSAALALQTGTVSGTVVFSIDHVSLGGVAVTLFNNPPTNASMTPLPPVITDVTIQPLTSGFNIVVTGFSNTRDITEADFTFTPTSGNQLQTSTFELTNVASTFQSYYASDASTAVGSEFVYTQLFNFNAGTIGTLQSVSVSLKNAQGASSAMTAHF